MDEIQEGLFQEIQDELQKTQQNQEPPTKLDKIGDILGAWAGAIILTFIAAIFLGWFFTIIPTIKFNFIIILKCWLGIWGLMFTRGALKNKMF